MSLAHRPDETSPSVRAFLADRGIAQGELDLAIDARDEMLGFLVAGFEGDRDRALFAYFRSGLSIADALLQVLRWKFGGRIGNVLDFASGYGRITRFLVREIQPESLWVADVYAEGVRFQEERFGVRGMVSAIRPADFVCTERFDAILVNSLFTHLPEARFVEWLRVLLGLLAPEGLLAFSAHSPEVLPPGVVMPESGFLFHATSESGSLDAGDYGSTWVTEAFVRAALEREGVPSRRIPRALCGFQDLYVAGPGLDFSSLDFQAEPLLFAEGARLSEGRLELDGWAAVRSGDDVRSVEVFLDGELLAAAPVDLDRADVAGLLGRPGLRPGWRCVCPIPEGASRSRAVLLLRAVDGRGVGHPLWAGSIERLLLAAARLEIGSLRHEKADAWAAYERERVDLARMAREVQRLGGLVASMEASRFWKLRNAWFRVKGALRKNTDEHGQTRTHKDG
jgi:SAM-dependent methyltransferase